MTILEQFQQHYAQLSPGKQAIADYINDHMNVTAYCNACELAQNVGVSNAQVAKFVKSVGFDSFKQMQKCIRDEVENHISMSSVFSEWKSQETGDLVQDCLKVIDQEIENIRNTVAGLDLKVLEEIAEAIIKAKRVAFLGSRGSAGCNVIPCVFIGQMRDNVFHITPNLNNSWDTFLWWGPEDIVLGANTYSYGTGYVSELLELARTNGCKTVWFTDSESYMQTPPSKYDYVVQYGTKNVLISYTSLLVVYNLLIYLVTRKLDADPLQQIRITERMMHSMPCAQPFKNAFTNAPLHKDD